MVYIGILKLSILSHWYFHAGKNVTTPIPSAIFMPLIVIVKWAGLALSNQAYCWLIACS